MNNTIELLKEFKNKKSFNTRGLPLTKKLWRDGYNRAIDDIITFLMIEAEKKEK